MADDTCEEILAQDVLEHLPEVVPFMDECWRLLRPGGKLTIRAVLANSDNHWKDPTHVRGFLTESFDYFDPALFWGQKFGRWYTSSYWKLETAHVEESNVVAVLRPRKAEAPAATDEGVRKAALLGAAEDIDGAGLFLRHAVEAHGAGLNPEQPDLLNRKITRLEKAQQGQQVQPAGPYAAYHRMQDEAIRSTPPYPSKRFAGAGIVMVAGGPGYFTCAWVCLTILRRALGCTLPIQVWYLGPDEMSREMIELLEPFGVECVDALEVRRRHPVRRLGGWECKPYAILHSPFKEVILLDADNVPLVDPAVLLAMPEYRRTGAIFWPDVQKLGPDQAIWEICRVPYRDEPAFESGQIVVDKQRCWRALQLTMHLNKWSDFYYQYVNGDKETYHLAWRMLDQPFGMPRIPARSLPARSPLRNGYLPAVLEQHDFDGCVIFHHRTGAKWSLLGENPSFAGFAYQDQCLAALRELRQRWSGRVRTPPEASRIVTSEAEIIQARNFLYSRIGADERVLELLPDHQIGRGRAQCETAWRLSEEHGEEVLVIEGEFGQTCRLTASSDGVWRGRWSQFEQMPVELIPLGDEAVG